MAGNIMVHTGRKFRNVTVGELRYIPTPEETRTWCPIGHGWLLDKVLTELGGYGYDVRSSDLRVSKDNMEFFGILNIGLAGNEDFGLSIGLRNTHNKRASAAVLLGTDVWMCDNLCYSAEHTFVRKHHPNSYVILASGIHTLMGNLETYAKEQQRFIDRMKNFEPCRETRHDILVRAAQKGAILVGDILKIAKEFDTPQPQNVEAIGTSAWALFNAATYVGKDYFERNPDTAAQRSVALSKLFNEVTP